MGAFYDRVMVATATVGTGTITLGAAVRSSTVGDYLTFSEAAIPDGTLVSYFIQDGNSFAEGEGVSGASGTTLTRDANEISWNGTTRSVAKLSLSGAAKVFVSPRAVDLALGSVLLQSGVVSSAVAAIDLTTVFSSAFTEYEIHLFARPVNTASNRLTFSLSDDGGATFKTTGMFFASQLINGAAGTSSASYDGGPSGANFALIDSNTSDAYGGVIRVWRGNASNGDRFHWEGVGVNSAGYARYGAGGGCNNNFSGGLTGLRLSFGPSNFDVGTRYSVNGVKK